MCSSGLFSIKGLQETIANKTEYANHFVVWIVKMKKTIFEVSLSREQTQVIVGNH